jgi:hypothetical protein
MWKNKERSADWGGVFGLSIIKHVTLQNIVAHDFQYDPRTIRYVRFQHYKETDNISTQSLSTFPYIITLSSQ